MRKVHKKMSNKKQVLTAIIAVLISVGLVATAVYATSTIGNDITVGGALVVTGATTLTAALTANGNVTLGNADSDQLTVNASTTFATGTIFSGSVTISEGVLTDSTILSADIKDGEIVNADINASAAIALSKIASTTAGKIIYSDGDAWVAMTTGTPYQLLQMDSAAELPEWTSSVNIDGLVLNSYTLTLGSNFTIGASAVTTSGNLLIGNIATGWESKAVTGDIAITNAGLTSISGGVIIDADINASAAIALSKIASTTAGKIVYSDGDAWVAMTTGTPYQLLQMDSAAELPEWTSSITIGSGGTAISKHLSATSLVTLSITQGTCSSTSTVGSLLSGAAEGDTVIATPQKAAVGVEDGNLSWNAYIDTANDVTLRVCNVSTTTAGTITAQTWRFDVWQH